MSRVLLDATALDGGPSGSATRLVAVAKSLHRIGHAVVVWHGVALRDQETWKGLDVEWVQDPNPPRGPWARWRAGDTRILSAVKTSRADLVMTEALPWMARETVPTIVTIHDLRKEVDPGVTRWLWHRAASRAVVAARRIHVPTAATATSLAELIPDSIGRIDVVPNIVVMRSLKEVRAVDLPDLPPRFVVAMGHPEARKDWDLVAAVSKRLVSPMVMVRAGRGRIDGPWIDVGAVNDTLRDTLFARASAVLCPSRLEGFGLVGLEALAVGGFVVASGIPAHREVLGMAASYFTPGDVEQAWVELERAINASSIQQAARCFEAREQAEKFGPAALDVALRASVATLAL